MWRYITCVHVCLRAGFTYVHGCVSRGAQGATPWPSPCTWTWSGTHMLLIKSLEPRPGAGVSHTRPRAPLQGRLPNSEIKLTPESHGRHGGGIKRGRAQEARKKCLFLLCSEKLARHFLLPLLPHPSPVLPSPTVL